MWPWQEETLATVQLPDAITPDPIAGRWRYRALGRGVSRWLFVVVDWNEQPPRIATAYSKRKDPI